MSRILVSSLGYRIISPAQYEFSGRRVTGAAPALGLAQLLPEPPDHVLLAATDDSWSEHGTAILEEVAKLGLTVERIAIGRGQGIGDLANAVRSIVDAVPPESKLVLDITGGWRWTPTLMYMALTYHEAQHRSELESVFYGAQSRQDGAAVSFLDLSPFVSAIEWRLGVSAFEEQGTLAPMGRVLERELARLHKSGHDRPVDMSPIRDGLRDLATALDLGLFLRAGRQARYVLDNWPRMDRDRLSKRLPIGRDTVESLPDFLEKIAVPPGVAEPSLDEEELRREIELARWLAAHGRLAAALRLLREWLVNRVLLGSGAAGRWLEHDARTMAEQHLCRLVDGHRALRQAGQPARVAALWDELSHRRNSVSHGGFSGSPAKINESQVRDLCERAAALQQEREWILETAMSGARVLLAPIGRSPGALFSALRHVRPERAIVIGSADTLPGAAKAAAAARYRGRLDLLLVADPWNCVGEYDALWKALRDLTRDVAHATVSMTGGTAAMQVVLDRLTRAAEDAGIEVERVIVVDPRPAEEQRKDPFRLGTLVPLGRG